MEGELPRLRQATTPLSIAYALRQNYLEAVVPTTARTFLALWLPIQREARPATQSPPAGGFNLRTPANFFGKLNQTALSRFDL